MTRRPKSRLPPKLPDPIRDHAPLPPRGPTMRDQLKDSRVAGRSLEFGRDEISTIIRRVARNEERSLLGCPAFAEVTIEQVSSAVEAVYGWTGDGPRARIAPQRTIDAFDAACARILEVARSGGRLEFATGRPASLFVLHRALAAAAEAEGGIVIGAVESATLHPAPARMGSASVGSPRVGSSRLRWLDRVAVITDGRALLGDDDLHHSAAEEFLYTVGRPDLVVADRTFAGVALAAGLEVVAFAGLDALALALAAWRGMAVRVVPLDEQRPPQAYLPLTALLEGPRAPV